MKLLLSLLLFASPAFARTYQIDLIQSHGPREVSRQDAIAMMTFARHKLFDIGVKTRLGRASFTKLLNPTYTTSNYANGVYWWQRHLPPRTNIIRHIVTPPFFENSYWYIAGVSPGICLIHWRYAISTSNAQLFNQDGLDRWYQSAIAMAHELGHIFGAKHVPYPEIMNPAATALPNVKKLEFGLVSIAQIYSCID